MKEREKGERSDVAYLIGGDRIRGLLRPWRKERGEEKSRN